jgi:hypothetical protein
MKRTRTRRVAALLCTALLIGLLPVGAGAADGNADDVAILADLPAAIAETEQANLAHYQSVLAQNPDNTTCGPLDGRVAAGNPFVRQSPLIVEQTDVAWVENDCQSRDLTSPEYDHIVRITFEYRKDGVWIPVENSEKPCAKQSKARQSVWLDCTNRYTYSAFPTAHPAIGLPHRAKFELVSPDKGFAPAYSNVTYLRSTKDLEISNN